MRLYDIESKFTISEFKCPCGCEFGSHQEDIDKNLIDKLNMIRILYNKPMVVTSGARCEDYNASVGGKPDSAHLPDKVTGQCRAADILVRSSEDRYTLLSLALKLGITRVGFGPNFLHIDTAVDLPSPVGFMY